MSKGKGKAGERSERKARNVKQRTKSESLTPTSEADYLSQDSPIPGQEYVCMSFVSPSDVIPAKDAFVFERYIKEVFLPKITTFTAAVGESPESVEQFSKALTSDLDDTLKDVSAFQSANKSRLDTEFAALNPADITISGFKVRGAYPDIGSAKKRAEALQRQDRGTDVFVAQMGAWCPVHPSAESIGDVVYDESELNTLMRMKREADEARDNAYVADTMERVVATRSDAAQKQEVQEAPDAQGEPDAQDAQDAQDEPDEPDAQDEPDVQGAQGAQEAQEAQEVQEAQEQASTA